MRNTRAKNSPRLRIPFYNEGTYLYSTTVAPTSPPVTVPGLHLHPPGSGFPPLGGLSSAVTVTVTVTVILPPVRDSSYTLPPSQCRPCIR